MPPAKTAPAWTIGPSFPQTRPPETARMIPRTLTMSVLRRMTFGNRTPLRKHLIWGMPEPAATGARKAHINPEIRTKEVSSQHQTRTGTKEDTWLSTSLAKGIYFFCEIRNNNLRICIFSSRFAILRFCKLRIFAIYRNSPKNLYLRKLNSYCN